MEFLPCVRKKVKVHPQFYLRLLSATIGEDADSLVQQEQRYARRRISRSQHLSLEIVSDTFTLGKSSSIVELYIPPIFVGTHAILESRS